MAISEIFIDQSGDLLVQPIDESGDPIVIGGTCRIYISGMLDGATVLTQYQDGVDWIDIEDAIWDNDIDPDPVDDTAYVTIFVHPIRFELFGSGAATSISVTLTYDPQ